MRTAIYIENGYTQVVLTPDNDFEEGALKGLQKAHHITVKEGEFYYCAGGWVREGNAKNSVILICGKDE